MDLITHIVAATKLSIDPAIQDFSSKFMSFEDARKMAKEVYLDMQRRYSNAAI